MYSNLDHRTRPSLPSSDLSLNLSSSLAGTPADTVHSLWYTDEQIFQAGTSNPLGLTNQCHLLQRPYPLAKVRIRLVPQLHGIRRGIGTKDGFTTMRGLQSLRKLFHHILLHRTLMSCRCTIPGEHRVTTKNRHTGLGVRTATKVLPLRPQYQRVFAQYVSSNPLRHQRTNHDALLLGRVAGMVLPLLPLYQVPLCRLDQLHASWC